MIRPFLTKFDPRTKAFSLVLVSILVLASHNWVQLALVTAVMLPAVPASGQTLRGLLIGLRRVVWFMIVIVGMNAATRGGSVMFDAWGVYITREGILSGLFLSARIVMLLWASSIFVWSTPLLDVLDGTASAMKFFRIPAGPVIMSTSIALNFVPILIQSAKKVKLAQLARGAEEPSGFLRQVRNTASLALPLFAEVFRSADSLAEAMDTRCYSSVRRRTQYRALRLSPADWWLAGGLIPYALLVLRAG